MERSTKELFPDVHIYIRSESNPDPFVTEYSNPANDLLNSFHVDLWDHNPALPDTEHIGEGYFYQLFMRQGMEKGFSGLRLFDYHSSSFELGEVIFDYDNNVFFPTMKKILGKENMIPNICVIQDLQLLAGYRGKGIGEKLIRDIYCRFGAACDLFVLEVLPHQFHNPTTFMMNGKEITSGWNKEMKWNLFEEKEDQAQKRLHNYVKQMGFENIAGSKYFYATSVFKNSFKRRFAF